MRQAIIILILFLGIVGGGYYLLNPEDVYDNAAAVQMTEIVVDDGETTLPERFSRELMEAPIEPEPLRVDTEATSSATSTEEVEEVYASTTEEIQAEEDRIAREKEQERLRTLPLGDGRFSDEPNKGYVFTCSIAKESEPEFKLPWVQGEAWYPNLKLKVSGDIFRKNTQFVSEIDGIVRTLAGNGLPKHGTGDFPVSADMNVSEYTNDSFSIRNQIVGITIPQNPKVATTPSCLPVGEIGLMLSGSYLHSALTENGLDAGARSLDDSCNGRPDRTGAYHYTRESSCISTESEEDSVLIGYALDGFGIYKSVEGGEKITNADLDVCHGHSHEIVWDGEERDMYHYHATDEFPYTLGCFKGSPSPN